MPDRWDFGERQRRLVQRVGDERFADIRDREARRAAAEAYLQARTELQAGQRTALPRRPPTRRPLP